MRPVAKALIFTAVFTMLHFGYELTEWKVLIPFCGTDESLFQHSKMGFWSWLVCSLMELILLRKRSIGVMYSRILGAILVPWFILLLWYVLPGTLGRSPWVMLEIIWGIICVFVPGFAIATMERELARNTPSRAMLIITGCLLVLALFFFIRFTISLPWIDLFVNPAGIPR
jgi:TRAP-type uncharacterized transport system fused permease subunit